MDRSRSPANLHPGNGQASPDYSPHGGMNAERGQTSLGVAQSKFIPAPKLPHQPGPMPPSQGGQPDYGQPPQAHPPRPKSAVQEPWPPGTLQQGGGGGGNGMQTDSLQSMLHSSIDMQSGGMMPPNDMQSGGMMPPNDMQSGGGPNSGMRPNMQSNPFQQNMMQQNPMQQNMMHQKFPPNMMHHGGGRHPGMGKGMRHPRHHQNMMQQNMMPPNQGGGQKGGYYQGNPMQQNMMHQGGMQQGGMQQGGMQQGAMHQGAVQQGGMQQGAMQQGGMQQGGMQGGMQQGMPQGMQQQGMPQGMQGGMQPGLMQQQGMGQGMMQQGPGQQGLPQPGVAQPGGGQYGQGQFNMGQPGMGHPGGPQQGMGHPGLGGQMNMSQPGMGMQQQGMQQQPQQQQQGMMQGGPGQMGMGAPFGPQPGAQPPLFKMSSPSGPPPPPPSVPPPPPTHPPPPPQPPDQQGPPPPPTGDATSSGNGAAGPDFRSRLEELRKEHPDVEVPLDAWSWTRAELEAFFESGGTEHPKAQERKSLTPRKRESSEVLEYEVGEALQLQAQLRDGFKGSQFQDALKRLQRRYPDRKKKGHSDGQQYFEAFESLTLSVHARVLPSWGLTADWDGVRTMSIRLAKALRHPKVRKAQEEINVLMGLPRNATFTPPKKGEEIFLYRPNADAPVPGFVRPLVRDEDGDEAHEFLVEDRETGGLKPQGPTALDTECWYQVVHRPAVVIREQPDEKSKMVGRKKTGKRLRVQKVVGGKWLQLHHTELVRLGVAEAWVLLDGAELGLSDGQQLLERVV